MFDDWKLTTFLLCCYGLFKEIRPSEPFLTEYLISNHTGVTEAEVQSIDNHSVNNGKYFKGCPRIISKNSLEVVPTKLRILYLGLS